MYVLIVNPWFKAMPASFSCNQPRKVILEDSHEDDDDEAQQQHHQHQGVDDGQPVDLQRFGEEGVVPEALPSAGVRERGLEPVHTVCVGDGEAAPTRSLLQGHGLDVFHRHVGKDHRLTVVLDVEVQVGPQTHLVQKKVGRKHRSKVILKSTFTDNQGD